MTHPDEISAAKLFAEMLEGNMTSKATAASKLISVRIPITALSEIDSFAEHTNSNRNKVVVKLLEAGIESVLGEISDDRIKTLLSDLRLKHLQKLQCEVLISQGF